MRLEYVSRQAWGAQYAAGSGPRSIPTAEAWLHHSVTPAPPDNRDREALAMRTIEKIGQQRFGAGFSYNLALMPSGRVYVGCGVRRIGSHTAGRNTRALGVVLVGDYDRHPLPPAMRAALPDLLRDAHDEGWIDAPRFDGGHRDLKATACPGRHAYQALPEINRDALGIEVTPAAVRTDSPTPARGPSMVIVKNPAGPDQHLVHMGRRWRIRSVEELRAYEKACPRVELPQSAFDRLVEAS